MEPRGTWLSSVVSVAHRPGSGQEVDVLEDEDERNSPPRECAGEERHDDARRREPGKRLRDGRVDGLGRSIAEAM